MPKGMSESLVTKITLGVIISFSVFFLGVVVYERVRVETSIVQRQQELKVYKDEGLGALNSGKYNLEKQLKFLQDADKELSGMLFSKPASKMAKEVGDPLKFKEELYKVQNKIREEGGINFQFPFWLGFERYEHDIPNPSDLPLRIKQLDIIREIGNIALVSKVPEISNIEFLEVKKVFSDNNKEILFMEFPVRITVKCVNDDLINFMQKLSVSDIPFRTDSFKIKVVKEGGETTGELTAEFLIVAAVLPAEKT